MPAADPGSELLQLYDRALPQVYGYLRARVGDDAAAEDLTAETFLAAVQATRAGKVANFLLVQSCWQTTRCRGHPPASRA